MRKRWLMIVPMILTLLLISSITNANHSIKILFHESEIPLDVSPQVINGRIMAPVNAIAEALGFDAKWDSKKSEVIITEKEPLSKLVATLPEAAVALYASESKGYYMDFELRIKNGMRKFPDWKSESNRDLKLFYSDINQDDAKEIIIILTTGSGTGVSEKEVHVFNVDRSNINKFMIESYVEDPIIIAMKNVKTKLTSSEAIITIGKKRTLVNIEKYGIEPSHLFNNLAYGNKIDFDVLNDDLIAILPTQLAPGGGSAGSIVITYEFKDNLYQAKKIDFKTNTQ